MEKWLQWGNWSDQIRVLERILRLCHWLCCHRLSHWLWDRIIRNRESNTLSVIESRDYKIVTMVKGKWLSIKETFSMTLFRACLPNLENIFLAYGNCTIIFQKCSLIPTLKSYRKNSQFHFTGNFLNVHLNHFILSNFTLGYNTHNQLSEASVPNI